MVLELDAAYSDSSSGFPDQADQGQELTYAYKEAMYPMIGLMQRLHAQRKLNEVQEVLLAPHRPSEELYDLNSDVVYASHNLHEATMYYPMRMVRTRRHKLIWNNSHGLTFPSALDLIYSHPGLVLRFNIQQPYCHAAQREFEKHTVRPSRKESRIIAI